MNIALICDPGSRHGAVWLRWLSECNHNVTVINDDAMFRASKNSNFDLVIPLITIHDYINRPNPRMEALHGLEARGAKLLTSSAAIAASSDKLLTYEAWENNGINQPATSLCDKTRPEWPHDNKPVIVKPRFGHSGNKVSLATCFDELCQAVAQIEGDVLVQEYVAQPTCIRLIATSSEVLCTYEKVLDGHVIVNIEKGAIRKYFEPSEELQRFTKSAIAALGSGLMGLDVLEKNGAYIALEANVPFGFDEENEDLKSKLLNLIAEIE